MNFRQNALTRRKIPPAINMTPLIDVVFILLIFFLLTTTFRNTAGLNVNLPHAATSETQNAKRQIILTVDRQGDLFFENQKTTQQDAITAVKSHLKEHGDLLIILQADEEVPHGKVVKVLDDLRNAGLKRVAIGAYPKRQP